MVANIGPDTRLCIPFVAGMISLILEHQKLVCFVVGTIIGQVGHLKKNKFILFILNYITKNPL